MEKLIESEKSLEVITTNIPDLLVINLTTDSLMRKKWLQEKLEKFGPPHLDLIQSVLSIGRTKNIQTDGQTESDRYLFVETGSVFGECVDLRIGESYGRSYMTEIDPSKAVFVPGGVECSLQTLDDNDNTICSFACPVAEVIPETPNTLICLKYTDK
ncbi:MAG: hypothetical protein ABI716_02920 [Candidatus Saccharibacteria bacterium]